MNPVAYLSAPHPCGYFDDRLAQSLFLDPLSSPGAVVYEALLGQGFRRSGGLVYRPQCRACQACVAVRVPVAEFAPDRSQRRVWKRLSGRVQVLSGGPRFDPEHYRLFRRYVRRRHPGGGMEDMSAGDYLEFLSTTWLRTRFHEFRIDQRLLAVAVTDETAHALSAVYTFFDPDREDLSPGVFSILWQIHRALAEGRRWLYLGYWIAHSPKMAYKARYRPLEAWDGSAWRPLEDGWRQTGR